MNRNAVIGIVLFLAALAVGYYFFIFRQAPAPGTPDASVTDFETCAEAGNPVTESYPAQCRAGDNVYVQDIGNELEKADLIRVESPRPGQQILNPLTVTGEARGTWFFEADFPVELIDGNRNVIATGIARAEGEWMTEEFVPFTVTLAFTNPGEGKGTLILRKNNPSDLEENQDSLEVPVRFAAQQGDDMQLRLYYYNQKEDGPDTACSPDAVLPVMRSVSRSQTPIRDTVDLLLKGQLTEGEKAAGFTTEFPLEGLRLLGADPQGSVLTLEFEDPQNKTSGGACRVGLLRAQIEKTLRQFPEVGEVRIIPEELFQP